MGSLFVRTTARVRPARVLALLAAALVAREANASTVDVTVTITSVTNISAGDVFNGAPDFLAKIYLVDGWRTSPTVFDSHGFSAPGGWSSTKTVSRSRSGDLVRLRIELWDYDAPFGLAAVDVDPVTGNCTISTPGYGCGTVTVGPHPLVDSFGLDLTVNLANASFTGDVAGSSSACVTGTEGAAASLCFTVAISNVRRDVMTVTKPSDSNRSVCSPNDCSLREAVNAAQSGDLILLPTSGVPYDLMLDARFFEPVDPQRGSHLAIRQDVVIQGPVDGGTAVIRQNRPDSRVFDVYASGSLDLSHVTVTQGRAGDNSTAFRSHIHGGGIHNHGYLRLRYVTLSGNLATDSTSRGVGGGGGIYNATNAYADLYSVTIADNVTVRGDDGLPLGGGIAGLGTYKLQNTVISNNRDTMGASTNCEARTVLDWGGNLQYPGSDCVASYVFATGAGSTALPTARADPLTGLRPSFTYAPIQGGDAVDRGDRQNCGPADQAGGRAPVDGDGDGTATCDVGAIELEAAFRIIPFPPPDGPVRRRP